MTISAQDGSDRLSDRLARLLSFGTWVSCGFIAAGMVLQVARAHNRRQSLVSAGIVLLIVLPTMRVATMGTCFLFHRDPDFAVIAALVLVIIIALTLLGVGAA